MVSDALLGTLPTAIVALAGIISSLWLGLRTISAQQRNEEERIRGEREKIHTTNLSSKQMESLTSLYHDLVELVQHMSGDTEDELTKNNNGGYDEYVSEVEEFYESFISTFGTASIFLKKRMKRS